MPQLSLFYLAAHSGRDTSNPPLIPAYRLSRTKDRDSGVAVDVCSFLRRKVPGLPYSGCQAVKSREIVISLVGECELAYLIAEDLGYLNNSLTAS